MVLRPTTAYGATVWWHRVTYKTNRDNLINLQRITCLGITGAMGKTSTEAVEVLLGLPPLI
jgi:hypothetical protein